MDMNILFVCLPHVCSTHGDQRKVWTGVTDGHEPPCGCWKCNLDPLQKQPVLLTFEPSPQPHIVGA